LQVREMPAGLRIGAIQLLGISAEPAIVMTAGVKVGT
jgi:hypothetical protein